MEKKKKGVMQSIPGWAWVLISLAAAILLWYALSINPKTARSFPFIPAILEAAKRFCFKGSIKNWTVGMTMKVRDEGLIEDYEYWTAERIANDMAEKARAGKRKLY